MTNKIIASVKVLVLVLGMFLSVTVVMAGKKGTEKKVLISTAHGDITIKLYDETPKHRDNFIRLVEEGKYDGTLFHRIINGFMIQGGDPKSVGAAPGVSLGDGGVGYTIPAEFNAKLIHKKGALAAARLGGPVNPNKESSGCQFYLVQGKPYGRQEVEQILKQKNRKRSDDELLTYTEEQYKTYETVGGTPHLDMDYTVFGEVVEGLDIIDKIAALQKDGRDRPTEDVPMKMKILKK